jgi:hypothetical protein
VPSLLGQSLLRCEMKVDSAHSGVYINLVSRGEGIPNATCFVVLSPLARLALRAVQHFDTQPEARQRFTFSLIPLVRMSTLLSIWRLIYVTGCGMPAASGRADEVIRYSEHHNFLRGS